MGNKFRVEVTTDLPPGKAEWAVDNGDNIEDVLIYNNLGYDLISAAMMKLGVEYSRYLLDKDRSRFSDAMEKVQVALRAGTVVD